MTQPLSKELLLERGKCCGNKCLNCPYHPCWTKGVTDIIKNKPKTNGTKK